MFAKDEEIERIGILGIGVWEARTRRVKKKRRELTKPPRMVYFSDEANRGAQRRRTEKVNKNRRADRMVV